jgi:hypothetical protein
MDLNGFTPSRRVEKNDERSYTVYVKPPKIVGEYPEVSVTLSLGQYQRYLLWRDGPMLIQEALPDLSPSEREMLMTGLADEDFSRMTRDPDDDA